MPISIDRLCEELEIKEISPTEYREVNASHTKYGTRFDGYALPTHRVIAPIVSEKLGGMPKVLEIGFGTGFRLAYYALNNPDTQFVGVDNDNDKLRLVRNRLDSLGVRNVDLKLQDIYETKINEWKFPAVVAIDCIPAQVSPRFDMSYQQFRDASVIYFAKMVDQSTPNAFLTMAAYGPWTDKHQSHTERFVKIAGIPRVQTIPFSYTRRNENTEEGSIIISS